MRLDRILGAVLDGAVQPQRRRRRSSTAGLLSGRSAEARLGRLLGGLVAGALQSMTQGGTSAPAPAPAPAPTPGRRAAPGRPSVPTPSSSARRPWEATAPAVPPRPEPEVPLAEEAEDLLLLRAMVAAAKADERIEPEERDAIARQLDAAGLSSEERDLVLAEFDTPLSPEALADQAGDPMLRARLYAAAFAAAGEVSAPERAWLDRLAAAMRLDRTATSAIERRLGGG